MGGALTGTCVTVGYLCWITGGWKSSSSSDSTTGAFLTGAYFTGAG